MTTVLRFLAWVLVLVAPSMAAASEVNVGAIRFSPPEGWARTERAGAAVFVAPRLPRDQTALLAVLPSDTGAGWPAPFDAAWAAIKAEHSDVEESAPAADSVNGYQYRIVGGSMADAGGRFLYLTFFSARKGRTSQPLVFVTTSAKLYDEFTAAVQESLRTVEFVDGAPPLRGTRPTIAALMSARPAAAASRTSEVPASTSPARDGGGGELVGTWGVGSVSPVGFYNPANGLWSTAVGTGESYELRADGSYVYAGLVQTSTYGCTTRIFLYSTGAWKAEGANLVLRQKTARTRSTDNCNQRLNYEKSPALKTETFAWRLQRDDSGAPVLVLSGDGGELEFRRR